MKKILIIIISIVGVCVLIMSIFWLGSVLKLGNSENNTPETLLTSSISPDGNYTLEAYKTEPGQLLIFLLKFTSCQTMIRN